MVYTSKDVPQPPKSGSVKHTITLKRGDTAWMPGTTKHVYTGPKTIVYTVYADGGVDSEVV